MAIDKKYQVFVSSTYDDLREERQEVMQALLELDCITSGMELFPATNGDQWSLIQRVIDECDYYILILAGRYGSVGEEGISYTEMEYRYALEKNKPIIAFIHNNPGIIAAGKTEQCPDSKMKLNEFKSLAKQKMCKFWETPAELGSVVSRSLVRLIKDNPGVGWVRASLLPDEDTINELLNLRKKVEQLQKEIESLALKPPQSSEGLANGQDLFQIRYTFVSNSGSSTRKKHKRDFEVTWNTIFSVISPCMINEASEKNLKDVINDFIKIAQGKLISSERTFSKASLGLFSVDRETFETIIVQFRALGLVKKSDKARSVKDIGTYWMLTPYGDNLMTSLRAIKRNESL